MEVSVSTGEGDSWRYLRNATPRNAQNHLISATKSHTFWEVCSAQTSHKSKYQREPHTLPLWSCSSGCLALVSPSRPNPMMFSRWQQAELPVSGFWRLDAHCPGMFTSFVNSRKAVWALILKGKNVAIVWALFLMWQNLLLLIDKFQSTGQELFLFLFAVLAASVSAGEFMSFLFPTRSTGTSCDLCLESLLFYRTWFTYKMASATKAALSQHSWSKVTFHQNGQTLVLSGLSAEAGDKTEILPCLRTDTVCSQAHLTSSDSFISLFLELHHTHLSVTEARN